MIPYGKHFIEEDDIDAVVQVLRSNHLTQGPAVEVFENKIAEYTGATFAVAVANGTAGLHLAYLAAEVKEGSTVLTTPITFVATANAAYYCGGSVEFVDINPQTLNLSADKACNRMEAGGIDVLAPVHFAGLPCDMEQLSNTARNCGCIVVEDAAHALGGKYKSGEKIGSCVYSDMTVFSFHPVKAIAAGEGGVITTNSEELYLKLLRLRSHGINKLDDRLIYEERAYTDGVENSWYYEMQHLGFNYRITDIQCALAGSQLKKLDGFIERRALLARRYDCAFSKSNKIFAYQKELREISGLHLYVVRINFENIGISRAEFILKLKELGVLTQVHYIPVPIHPFYEKLGFRISDFPCSEEYYMSCLSIPLFPSLSDEQQQYVIKAIGAVLNDQAIL